MRHTWTTVIVDDEPQEWCLHCDARKRYVVRRLDVNPARHTYRVMEYSANKGYSWRWIRSREAMPPCCDHRRRQYS
jgi:hypothetical protein